ncbi:hypothetical protein M5689_013240 [Euphorbia peplus]|nr:hypothetical protein M5689_013240 [Euphorbia peplus]
MFDLEEGITMESHSIPWLFWIQILIFFLLIFLLCCFSVLSSDPFHFNNTCSSSPSSIDALSFLNKGVLFHHHNLHRRRNHQVTESRADIKGDEVATSSSGRRIIIREEDTENEAGLSTNVLNDIHPCNYFRLAKLAFLKCFGLDATSDHSSTSDSTNER